MNVDNLANEEQLRAERTSGCNSMSSVYDKLPHYLHSTCQLILTAMQPGAYECALERGEEGILGLIQDGVPEG